MLSWPTDLLHHSPWFTPLLPALRTLGWRQFPTAATWASLPADLLPITQSGQTVRFVSPSQLDEQGYELRIAQSGEVATRPDNWHDCFNALCWLGWPKSKAALNGQHLHELSQSSTGQRNRARDAATLFDESGLVLACAAPDLVQALHNHDWKTLFQVRRADWSRQLAAYCFGHALQEKGLAPFIGIVAKVVVVEVPTGWFDLPLVQQIAELDSELAQRIGAGQLREPRALPPLPVLGIPGWWPVQNVAFYADTQHFRPKNLPKVSRAKAR
ncbi:DUF3025 domain-containing protein [Chitinimonas sp. BJB300]|uniref:DUF3025 domain-containing protein n=1 Tax=Chitinimonas sp. BJB300 TaxID=1559339 RepID=UPI000C0FB593|nr:DUF3025 domain-containing protein [Chitinimonas sp. BJB300]PHV11589.1 hypothetical protein CSQ89_10010 [Chitinimonas sp. BJB300]TSJ88077.1 DUF3025 domain-containing protein [Chitinimonas sp. BJB300]